MSRKTIGIVDYSVGNHASVCRTFEALGYRCRISFDYDVLKNSDLVVLPGVGAYPTAMSALNMHGLVEFLRERAIAGQALLGLCLGMQLLADSSLENGKTLGLGIIPGEVVPLDRARWHIGWNTIEVVIEDNLFSASDGESFYFNHSYVFKTSQDYEVCVSRLTTPFTVGVRYRNTVGLQFHPEKSQLTGQTMLKHLIEGLTSA
jgi:glutamine amidotransferase